MLKSRFPSEIKRVAPFSLRLSPEERRELEKRARGRPVGEYIKDIVFHAERTPKRLNGHVIADEKEFAKALNVLGKSRLSQNLNQLAKAANSGSLQVNEETMKRLDESLKTISWLREAFIRGMKLKPDTASRVQKDDPQG